MLGIWIFMLLLNLMMPLTMIGFGSYFYKQAPGEINSVFGYRTSRSMKNMETWNFAHHYCGKLWRITGIVMLLVSVFTMSLIYGRSIELISKIGSIICAIQVVILIASIFPTEAALKKEFDSKGRHRQLR